jgi:hypothetical protein
MFFFVLVTASKSNRNWQKGRESEKEKEREKRASEYRISLLLLGLRSLVLSSLKRHRYVYVSYVLVCTYVCSRLGWVELG